MASWLSALSRRELVAVCEKLCAEVGPDKVQSILSQIRATTTTTTTPVSSSPVSNKKLKPSSGMDFSKHPSQQTALWVAYFGENYMGVQSSNPMAMEDDHTVEWSIFQALRKVRLIPEDDDSILTSFSRCGRTDRGVSALGQVLCLKMRASPAGKPSIDYSLVLNRVLPKDIMVLAHARVDPDSFNARFSCTSRTYRYFFRKEGLDLECIQAACRLYEGTHDFRNFCKIDLDNNRTFVRRVDSCRVVQEEGSLLFVEIKGSGFLWHQIRLLMTVLYLVGSKLEPPTVISDLLNVEAYPARPAFNMADDHPLLLFAFEYKDKEIPWEFSSPACTLLLNRLHQQMGHDQVRLQLTKTFFQQVQTFNEGMGSGGLLEETLDLKEVSTQKKRDRHQPLLGRVCCKSVEDRLKEEEEEKA